MEQETALADQLANEMSTKYVSLCCHPHRLQHLYRYGVIFYSGLWRHNTAPFWSAHCCACVWVCLSALNILKMTGIAFTLMFSSFELLGMGNACAGIHIRKKPIWTSSSGENSRMTWLMHTQALNGSSMGKRRAWDAAIQMFQVKPRNGTFFVSLNIIH